MKHASLVLVISFALAAAATAADRDRGARQQARYDAAVARMAARSRPVAPQARRAPMPQAQRQIARAPQARAFNRQPGMGPAGGMDSDVSVGPRLGPRMTAAPAVQQPVFTPPVATNTAATIDRTSRRERFEPRTGRRGENDRGGRNRNWQTRDGRTGNLQNQTTPAVDGALQNPTTPVMDGALQNQAPTVDGALQNQQAQTGQGDTQVRNEHRSGGRRERHRDWHERHEGDPDFADKHRRYHRQHYNRDWWRRNYSRFVLFGGGYYYWNRGYWYPAYGYDPYYSTYTYDAPLYSYDGLSPAQVIGRVQAELQRRGYYRGAVDGSFGPATRQALMNYQADVGLPMTGEIDEETLNSFELR
ncbi:MAG: peptidoglycan-binding protein [Chthoniobacterales bacterium]|nr:peptidoglycan-binding protein [Chthoniobacterales bacterium]